MKQACSLDEGTGGRVPTGVPTGLLINSRTYDDMTVTQVANVFENATPGRQARPKI